MRMSQKRMRKLRTNELTDEQIVKQAIERNNQFALTTDDLFGVFGVWSPFYLIVMFMNGMIYAMSEMHIQIVTLSKSSRQDFRFRDCNKIVYDTMNDSTLIVEKTIGEESLTAGTAKVLANLGEILGSVLTLLCQERESSLVLIGSTSYAIGCLLMIWTYMPVLKFAHIVLAAGSQMCRIAVLMHCLECVPGHVRPMAMLVMTSMGVISTGFTTLLFRVIPDWWDVYVICGTVYFFLGVIYYCFVPASILNSLVNGKRNELAEVLEYWKKKDDDYLDVDALVDDVNFRGQVTVTKWDTVTKIFKVVPFRRKLIVIAFIIPMCSILSHLSDTVALEMTYVFVFEREFIKMVFSQISFLGVCVIIYRYGRRCALITCAIMALVGQTAIFVTEIDEINLCEEAEQPSPFWATIASIGFILVHCASKIGSFTAYLMLIEHIPTKCRRLVLPLVVTVAIIVQFIYFSYAPSSIHDHYDFYPTAFVIPSYIWCMIAGIVCSLIDDSGYMCVTTAEIPCYTSHRVPYPENPYMDDKTEYVNEDAK